MSTSTQPTAAAPMAPDLARGQYQLSDNLWATQGHVFLSGTQALVRLMLMQRQQDQACGWNTQGFISGYRGSPLGQVDQAVWKAGPRFAESGLRFLPAINEELAATAVLGTQRVESDPERTVDGVFALWYGKGPGVDRASDALKHGNAYGSSPHGGVLVVAGDDHGCVSSSMPHQSDFTFQAFSMPVVAPANVAELLEFGLYGWALSRYCGAWVGLTALSEVVESAGTVDLDAIAQRVSAWQGPEEVQAKAQHQAPEDGLHYRWPDLPSLRIESRLADKLTAVRAFSSVNSIDRMVIPAPKATVGIVTCGKAHLDLMEVLRRLEITPAMLETVGVRLYKVGLSFPLDAPRMAAFAQGLSEVLVIEEKGALVETQMRDQFYNAPPHARPAIVGKCQRDGTPLVSALGELRPSRLIELVAHWLGEHFPSNAALGDHFQHVRDFTVTATLSNAADGVKRLPYFCAGCPHNTSTKVPQGSTARAGIGCHFMANWMDRDTAGLIQMGGEGVDWVSHAMFTKVPHVFQNLGDGTYYHSGYLAIRQAVAAKATLTYKILFNDAVAMTGGQPVDGLISVDAIARQVESEGVAKVVVLSDDIDKYDAVRGRFPAYTEFFDRSELDAVQRRLRDTPGVTVLIYEQTCAAEKRRRRKKEPLAEAPKRLFINEAVCEGCGDCTVQSNCVAVLPHETSKGRKRRIDQSSCNMDHSCAKGFCPSFVSVGGAQPRKRAGSLAGGADAFLRQVAALPLPPEHEWHAPYDLLVTGVGGTGVVTVGAVVAMAAHLEGKSASVLDFMGFAQKGGAVLSFVRLADRPERLNQVRIDVQQADALLACDIVVGATPEALQAVRHSRTRVLANTHEVPVAESLKNPDADLRVPLLLDKLRHVAGEEWVETFDAQALAEEFVGDTIVSNILAMGYAWQRGLIPVGLAAITRAIELNGVAVQGNQWAFALGRLAAAQPQALQAMRASAAPTPRSVDEMVADQVAHLTAYQDRAWAQRFERSVDAVRRAECALGAAGANEELTRAVALGLGKLMSYKDEYEVARLYTDPAFKASLKDAFEGEVTLGFHLAPPLLARPHGDQPPRKLQFGAWVLSVFAVLAKAKGLRGTWADVFGRTAERRMERELIVRYETRLQELLPLLAPGHLTTMAEWASLPQRMRGFGHVKQANVALAQLREAHLLHRMAPARYPAPPSHPPKAGQWKGIPVVSA